MAAELQGQAGSLVRGSGGWWAHLEASARSPLQRRVIGSLLPPRVRVDFSLGHPSTRSSVSSAGPREAPLRRGDEAPLTLSLFTECEGVPLGQRPGAAAAGRHTGVGWGGGADPTGTNLLTEAGSPSPGGGRVASLRLRGPGRPCPGRWPSSPDSLPCPHGAPLCASLCQHPLS